MSEMLSLTRILVVRNDSTTSWESSKYILNKGEFGVGYHEQDGQLLPIVKVGDGERLWKHLPQAEGLILEDLKLSESFGRHKIEDGWVNAGGKGMTWSSWIKDALCQKKEKPEEIKVYPFIKSIDLTYETNTGTREPGSKLTKVHWIADVNKGKYVFGSCDKDGNNLNTTEIKTNYSLTLIIAREDDTIAVEVTGFKGTVNIEDLNIYLEEGKNTYGKVYITLGWDDATNYPLNNFREPMFEHLLVRSINEKVETITIEPNNVFCFYGILVDRIDDSNINSDVVHLLQNNLPTQDSPKKQIFTIPVGAKTVMIACQTSHYVSSVYNKTIGAEVSKIFMIKENVKVASTTDLPGANYDVYYFIPAVPYQKKAEIIFTLEEKDND